MSERLKIEPAPGWQAINPDELPEGILGGTISGVQKILTFPLSESEFAPNFVVLRSPIPAGEDPDQVLLESGKLIKESIPGFIMIEDCFWPGENETWRGMLRTGIYILDENSLTVSQWAWISPTSDGGEALWTASFTCSTHSVMAHQEAAANMIETLEVEL